MNPIRNIHKLVRDKFWNIVEKELAKKVNIKLDEFDVLI
jgi:hypothetical protein